MSSAPTVTALSQTPIRYSCSHTLLEEEECRGNLISSRMHCILIKKSNIPEIMSVRDFSANIRNYSVCGWFRIIFAAAGLMLKFDTEAGIPLSQ